MQLSEYLFAEQGEKLRFKLLKSWKQNLTHLFLGSEGMLSTKHSLVILKLGLCNSCAHEVIIHGTPRLTAAHGSSNFSTMFTFLEEEENGW